MAGLHDKSYFKWQKKCKKIQQLKIAAEIFVEYFFKKIKTFIVTILSRCCFSIVNFYIREPQITWYVYAEIYEVAIIYEGAVVGW